MGYLLARAELLRLFVSEFQITSRGSIAVEIGCQSRKKVAEAPADRSNPGDMVARPRIVGMEIIHNCCVLQPVRRLHQQRSAIGTRVLVAEVMSGTKIFHHAIPLDQIGGKPKGDTVINNRKVDRALKLADRKSTRMNSRH